MILAIAAQTLRGRWRLSVGTFLALAFGVLLAGSTAVLLADPNLPPQVGGLLGVVASVSCFVAIFVVAGTYAGPSVVARPTAEWITASSRTATRDSWIGIAVLLGACLVYTVLAIANTQLMAADERAGDIRLLRRVGATPGQAIRMVVWETTVSVGVGAVLGVAVAMVSVTGVWAALRTVQPAAVLVVPWWTFIGVAVLCLGVAVGTAVLSVLRPARG